MIPEKKERYPANRFGTKRICIEIIVVHLQKTRSPKTTAKLITTCIDFFEQYFGGFFDQIYRVLLNF